MRYLLLSFVLVLFSVELRAQEPQTQNLKTYDLRFENVYKIPGDELINNLERVLSVFPPEARVSLKDDEVEIRNVRGEPIVLKAKSISLKVPVTAEQFLSGYAYFDQQTRISNPSYIADFSADMSRPSRGIGFRASGYSNNHRLFPDAIFRMEIDPSKADNASEVLDQIREDFGGTLPEVDRYYRLQFHEFLVTWRTDRSESMKLDAIPNEFILSNRVFSTVQVNPHTKEPTIYIGDARSFQLILKASQIQSGEVTFSKDTPAFEDPEDSDRLAADLSRPLLGIQVRAEQRYSDQGHRIGARQIWTIDLRRASNYSEVIAEIE